MKFESRLHFLLSKTIQKKTILLFLEWFIFPFSLYDLSLWCTKSRSGFLDPNFGI